MTLREILVRRDAIRVELRGILDANPTGLPDDIATRADALETEAGRLNDLERRQVAVDEMDRRAAGAPLNGGPGARLEVRAFEAGPSAVPEKFDGAILRAQDGDRVPVLEHRHRLTDFLPPTESRVAELGLGGFLRALYRGPGTDLERRVMGEASIGTGGAMVPTPLASEVIDLMRARSVAFAAGARTIPMTSQTLKFARIITDPVGAWRNESAPIIEGQPAFDQLPLTARSWAMLCRVPRELLDDATNIDSQLRAVFGAAAGLALDRAILSGSGTPPEPRGIANTVGIQTLDMGATAGALLLNWSPILDALLLLDTANAGDPTAMVMSPRSARAIGAYFDTTGQVLQPPPRIARIPQLVTTSIGNAETHGTAVNASSILIGDFSQVFVGMRTELQISVLTERFADVGEVAFVLWVRADVAMARPASMVKISGVIPPVAP